MISSALLIGPLKYIFFWWFFWSIFYLIKISYFYLGFLVLLTCFLSFLYLKYVFSSLFTKLQIVLCLFVIFVWQAPWVVCLDIYLKWNVIIFIHCLRSFMLLPSVFFIYTNTCTLFLYFILFTKWKARLCFCCFSKSLTLSVWKHFELN